MEHHLVERPETGKAYIVDDTGKIVDQIYPYDDVFNHLEGECAYVLFDDAVAAMCKHWKLPCPHE